MCCPDGATRSWFCGARLDVSIALLRRGAVAMFSEARTRLSVRGVNPSSNKSKRRLVVLGTTPPSSGVHGHRLSFQFSPGALLNLLRQFRVQYPGAWLLSWPRNAISCRSRLVIWFSGIVSASLRRINSSSTLQWRALARRSISSKKYFNGALIQSML